MHAATIPAPQQRILWRKVLLILAAVLGLVAIAGVGIFLAYSQHATDTSALKSALAFVESGAVPDEPVEFAGSMDKESAVTPAAVIAPGLYTNITTVNDVTYTVALALQGDGKYDYVLTIGNSRVYKTYKHSGDWFVKGRVFHTVMKSGDLFLAAPATRDAKTPSREHIVEASQDYFVLQAHYGSPVKFDKAVKQ